MIEYITSSQGYFEEHYSEIVSQFVDTFFLFQIVQSLPTFTSEGLCLSKGAHFVV